MTDASETFLTEFSAGIYARGLNLDPALVSEKIGVLPTEHWKKGDKHTSGGRVITRKSGMWCYLSDAKSNDLDLLIMRLIDPLTKFGFPLPMVEGVETAELAIFASTDLSSVGSTTASFILTAETIGKISRLGVGFSLEFFVSAPEYHDKES